jgi:hypothetical protein
MIFYQDCDMVNGYKFWLLYLLFIFGYYNLILLSILPITTPKSISFERVVWFNVASSYVIIKKDYLNYKPKAVLLSIPL